LQIFWRILAGVQITRGQCIAAPQSSRRDVAHALVFERDHRVDQYMEEIVAADSLRHKMAGVPAWRCCRARCASTGAALAQAHGGAPPQ
jgi:hypothetical protein